MWSNGEISSLIGGTREDARERERISTRACKEEREKGSTIGGLEGRRRRRGIREAGSERAVEKLEKGGRSKFPGCVV